MTDGYIVLACRNNKYLDMAINLAASLRCFDPGRRICLAHDDDIAPDEISRSFFDDFVQFEKSDRHVGVMNKIRLYHLSPYQRTMYVDADCLLVRPNIGAYWDRLAGQYFNMTGEKRVSGQWYGMDIGQTVREFKIPYVVKMNSGVFYFEKSDNAERLFLRMEHIFNDRPKKISSIHQGIAGQYADEPFFGVVMGEFLIDPVGVIPGHGSWMVTTWNARRLVIDPKHGVASMEKASHTLFGLPRLPIGWVKHSPNFMHFIGLKPESVYQKAADWFRDHAACDPGRGETNRR